MKRVYDVLLNDILVGHLQEGDDSKIAFRMHDDYRSLPGRPVLSQSFEDDLSKTYRGKGNQLPAFFANLTPEGKLRDIIERSLRLTHPDELGLLESVGHDLPGAVIITPSEEALEPFVENGNGGSKPHPPDSEGEELTLRFSLAGVQLKFSVLRDADKITLPVHGAGGEWIVKLDSPRYPHLPQNEYATLQWARAAGFEVPECHLESVELLDLRLREFAQPDSHVLLIQRYDRTATTRIHQEDFAQVVNQVPDLKYDHVKYEQCAALVLRVAGTDQYFEFIRRLVFVVASGNSDAHLKNWSFIYPDGIHPILSPLYDQVSVIAWPEFAAELSLKLAGVKHLKKIDKDAFARLAKKAGANIEQTLETVSETLGRIHDAWQNTLNVKQLFPSSHAEALEKYWKQSQLMKAFA